MKRIFASLLLLVWGAHSLWAATATKTCPDFTDLSAGYVEPYASRFGNVLVEGRHTVITTQGTDPRTGGKLHLLPDGVKQVVRLGDELGGNQNESLTYHVNPSWDANLFLVKFAVVFENPNHIQIEQPYFSISVKDAKGNVLPRTFSYNVYANKDLDGFEEYTTGKTSIMWRDWTDVVIDLTHYIGQDVSITFYTRDCLQNGHFAYAYFTASCASNFASIEFCDGNNSILSLLSGFVSYLWSDGTESNRYEGSLNQPMWCDVTSITGELSRIFVSLANKSAPTEDVVEDVVCQGAPYYWNGNYIDTHFEGMRIFYGVEVDRDECSLTNKMLHLTTIPVYTVFNKTICEGESYMENGFSLTTPPVGNFTDTIEVDAENGCRHWNVLNLSVVPKNITPTIDGNERPCTETMINYTVYGNYECQWTLPKNAELVDGKLTSASVGVKLTDAEKGAISVSCSNGCVSKTVSMPLSPVKTQRSYSIDTICQGTSYEKNGWNLGIQNKLGYSTFIRQMGDSCGGSEVLVLYVKESPNVSIRSSVDVVCPGKEAELEVVNNYFIGSGDVAIGDVWCEDGSILKLRDFLKSGKKAKGLVFELRHIENGITAYIISVVDENGGAAVPYDVNTMDSNSDIISGYSIDIDFDDIISKWNVLNKYLTQIEGADLLEGVYWSKFAYSGYADTHRLAFGDFGGTITNKNTPIEENHKIRYYYTIGIR